MKKPILVLVLMAVAGWAVWYFVIREKTLGEKIDDATRQAEKSVNEAVKKISP